MIDLTRLQNTQLKRGALLPQFVGRVVARYNFECMSNVEIVFEGDPIDLTGPVIFAMNHPDRYNYLPFQYKLLTEHGDLTSAWVKGKYYENPFLAWFMENINNIPTVSRGYLITRDFISTIGRKPTNLEYRWLRRRVDRAFAGKPPLDDTPLNGHIERLLSEPRVILGRRFEPEAHLYWDFLVELFEIMMGHFVELNAQALENGYHLLIFPEGTRSRKLGRGKIGIAEAALYFKRTIIPVGCNGSEKLYPGDSPFADDGRVVYRFGEPIRPERELKAFEIDDDFAPFTRAAEERFRDRFEGLTELVMERIGETLDSQYLPDSHTELDDDSAAERFV